MVLSFSALGVAACAPDAASDSESSADELDGTEVFGARILDLRLDIDAAARASLGADPKKEVPGALTVRDASGNEVRHVVEVRLKGSYTLQGLDKKPSFKIKFPNALGFYGLKSLTLNGMTQDKSMLRESLAYKVYAAAGTPAPRTGFATVSVNEQPYGLYVNVESLDSKFLIQHFGAKDGIVYEASWNVDLRPGDIAKYELEAGADEGAAQLTALVAAIDAPGDGVFYGPDAKVDAAPFVRTIAASAVLNDKDNYAANRNNYRLHRASSNGKWVLVPTGQDQSFARTLDPFGFDARLFRKCMSSDRCFADYTQALASVTQAFEALRLKTEVTKTIALIDAAGRADPRKPYRNADVDAARSELSSLIAQRPAAIRKALECVAGGKEKTVGGCTGVTLGAESRCMDVLNASRDEGAAVIGYECHAQSNQRFRQVAAPGGTTQFVGMGSGRCLDVTEPAPAMALRSRSRLVTRGRTSASP